MEDSEQRSPAVAATGTPQRAKKANKQKSFEEHWTEELVNAGLLDGTLFEGVIRINAKNYKEAYIASPDGTDDILIEGLLNRNRALNGDVVICQLIPASPSSPGNGATPKRYNQTPVKTPKRHEFKNKEAKKKNDSEERRNRTKSTDAGTAAQENGEHQQAADSKAAQTPKKTPFKKERQVNKNRLVQSRSDEPTAAPTDADQAANVEPSQTPKKKKLPPRKERQLLKQTNQVVEVENNGGSEGAEPQVVQSEGNTAEPEKKKPNRVRKKTTRSKEANEVVDVVDNVGGSVAPRDEAKSEVPLLETKKEEAKEEKEQVADAPEDTENIKDGKENAKGRKKTRRSKGNKKIVVAEELTVVQAMEASPCKVVSHCIIEHMTRLEITMDTPEKDSQKEVANTTEANPSRKTAKVVFIKEMRHSRRSIGHLREWPYGQCGPTPKWILFSPKDHRVPRLKIPYTPDLASYMAVPSMLFLAQIDTWEDVNHPLGSLCYYVGKSGDIEAETVGLLLEHDVDYAPFPPEVLQGLPELPWSVPSSELEKRRDYRDHCIFTIDPSDARDLDDAVCGRFLKMDDDGVTKVYQISVHIADVSFFIKENTPLDEMASQRATSTYLVDRVIPMLPSVLCEHVCSLNPGEDRLAFSVEWIINSKGEILEEWFGRSVIRSCVKLSYDHAQAVIEGREEIDWPEIKGPHKVDGIRQSIQVLQEMAGYLRKKRVDQGALRIDLPRLAFTMDWSTRTPVGFRVYELKESNRLIEEFMLLANMRVAEKIYGAFPAIAVLRCHPPPLPVKLEQLANTLETIGIHLDVSSSAALQESLLRYGQSSHDPISVGRNLVISNLLAKPMKCAMYICSGLAKKEEHFRHFALSVPFYTHFTSPIRRYPDILVHRLLNAALEQEAMAHWEQRMVKQILDNCNSRKLAAKALQEQHSELHLANLIRKSGSIEAKGIVLAVLDRSVDVVLLYLGVIRRLYLDKLPLEDLRHEKYGGIGKLTLVWRPETPASSPVRQTISVFSLLEIQLVPHTESDKLDFNLVLQRPSDIPIE